MVHCLDHFSTRLDSTTDFSSYYNKSLPPKRLRVNKIQLDIIILNAITSLCLSNYNNFPKLFKHF